MSKKHQIKNSFLLDTSVHIMQCKYPEWIKYFEKRKNAGNQLVSSFFVLYEFKTGLIKNVIDFYFMVDSYGDVSKALAKWSESFKARELKNLLIINSILTRINESINFKDIPEYLRKLEAVIFDLTNNFNTFLDEVVGNFGNDEIVKFSLKSKKDFSRFLDMYNQRKEVIPLDEFWEKNNKELDKLLADNDFKLNKKLSGIYENLGKVKKDITNANKHNCNRSIGDAVIAVDCNKKRTITSFDNSFSYLCKPLNKKSEILDKNIV